MESDIVSGQLSAWVLLKKLGEGDAGEVYLVESLLEKQPAILKRPARSAFAGDVIRQTGQITAEGKILRALSEAQQVDPEFPVNTPQLLDQSKPGTAYSERMFIVIEQASGFDLALLARTAQFGVMSGTETLAETPEEKYFLRSIAESGRVPERIILSAMQALLVLFDKIHYTPVNVDGVEAHGILWNDVKPEHLYWDPWRARMTVIDWGNSQMLQADGATRDRQYSAADDYRQWIDAMGKFLEQYAPQMLQHFTFPVRGIREIDYNSLQSMQEQIADLLQRQAQGLQEARQRELDLLRRAGDSDSPQPASTGTRSRRQENPLTALETLHKEIIGYGELPDYSGALSIANSQAQRAAQSGRMSDVEDICAWTENLPGGDATHLRFVMKLARMAAMADSSGTTPEQYAFLRQAVESALRKDFADVLWSLVSALRDSPEPDWWFDLIATVRNMAVGSAANGAEDLQPMLIVRRALLTLQAMAERIDAAATPVHSDSRRRLHDLVRRLREDITANWLSLEPPPPYGGLAYQEIEDALEDIGAFLPDARAAIERALAKPRIQAQAVLSAWDREQFEAASEGLRQVLLYDPDRKRVLRAETAIRHAPPWLERVQNGPRENQPYREFAADIEFEGRELRNQVGPARWLDLILDGCRQLRRGVWPPDLFTSHPQLILEMPWLRRFERIEKIPAEVAAAVQPEAAPGFSPLNGAARGTIGPEDDLCLSDPLDGWVAEARGSSARVFGGALRDGRSMLQPVAMKLMRMDKVDYALPLFREEVLVLNVMRDIPGVTPLYECGFLQLGEGSKYPTGRENGGAPVTGSLQRIGPSNGKDFIEEIEARIEEGWTPYLAIGLRDSHENLLALCDAGQTGGVYRPVTLLLQIAIQICDILHEAHQRRVVYRDHKILHYYWNDATHGVWSIDWNVARLHPEGLPPYEIQMDLVQFGARALHHILTGRTAPGALPLGPTRPEEIEQAAKSYQAQWTYDDQRLPEDLRGILERVLAGEYNSVIHLRDDLKESFLKLP